MSRLPIGSLAAGAACALPASLVRLAFSSSDAYAIVAAGFFLMMACSLYVQIRVALRAARDRTSVLMAVVATTIAYWVGATSMIAGAWIAQFAAGPPLSEVAPLWLASGVAAVVVTSVIGLTRSTAVRS